MADSKLTALSEISVPALEDLTYLVDDPAGTPASAKVSLTRLGGLLLAHVCQGRLTTESGVAVSTSDRVNQSTLYFALYNGNRVALYDGTRWNLYTFTERSLSLSSLTSGKNYDVFLYDNAGTLTLELSAAWTNDTTRADALTTQDGVYVKDGAPTRRYLGTVRTTGTTTVEDSAAKRFVWNLYNRLSRPLRTSAGTVDLSWTLGTGGSSFREINGGTSLGDGKSRFEFVRGLSLDSVFTRLVVLVHNNSALQGYASGIGVDSTTTDSATSQGTTAGSVPSVSTAVYHGFPTLGYHKFYALEAWATAASSGSGFYGPWSAPTGRDWEMTGEVSG